MADPSRDSADGWEENQTLVGRVLFSFCNLLFMVTDTIILHSLSYARKKRAVFYRTLHELLLL